MKRNYLIQHPKRALGGVLAGAVALLLLLGLVAGCETMDQVAKVGTDIAASTGVISKRQAQSIQKSTVAVARTFEDITPEQEYYIGRTIGAVVLSKYPAYNNPGLNRYINLLGQTLARASDRPETYGGYHFLVLDSDDINAFAAPGGLIFVTRGLLRCCRNEDALASVLAHEIGHVQYKHGLQAIRKSRITSALTILGVEGAKTYGGKELASLTKTFEDSISDITKTLINNGYSRAFERQADRAAIDILRRVGYSPQGLVNMLLIMDRRLKPGGPDFAKTHPAPRQRIADIQKVIGTNVPLSTPSGRQARFLTYMGHI